ALVVGVLTDFPFARPDIQRRDIVVEPVAAEIADAVIDPERRATPVGIGIQRRGTVLGAMVAAHGPALVIVVGRPVTVVATARIAEPVGAIPGQRIIIAIRAIRRRIAVMVDLHTRCCPVPVIVAIIIGVV